MHFSYRVDNVRILYKFDNIMYFYNKWRSSNKESMHYHNTSISSIFFKSNKIEVEMDNIDWVQIITLFLKYQPIQSISIKIDMK